MATLVINKNYAEGEALLESDIDDIRDAVLELVNTSKLNDENIRGRGIDPTEKLQDNAVSSDKLADGTVTRANFALKQKIPEGCVQLFHTFSGTVNIPRGWLICDGSLIGSSTYDALHGSGSWSADGGANSSLSGLLLPNMTDKYAIGTADTTESGSTNMASVGNIGSKVNFEHNHQWFNDNGTSNVPDIYGNVGQTLFLVSTKVAEREADGKTIQANPINTSVDSLAKTLNIDAHTANALEDDINIQPESIELIYLMKVL